MNFELKRSALALTFAATCGLAQATPLLAEAITANVDVMPTFFGGTLLETAITQINNASYNGIARTAVYDTGSGLDFYYQFSNDPSSVNGIERFTGYNFTSVGASTPLQVYKPLRPLAFS